MHASVRARIHFPSILKEKDSHLANFNTHRTQYTPVTSLLSEQASYGTLDPHPFDCLHKSSWHRAICHPSAHVQVMLSKGLPELPITGIGRIGSGIVRIVPPETVHEHLQPDSVVLEFAALVEVE